MRFRRKSHPTNFVIQLTSMVDIFTIILLFLLKSYSTSSVHISPGEGIKLPLSYTAGEPKEAVRVLLSKSQILVGDEKVLDLVKGKIPRSALDAEDRKFITALFDSLSKSAKQSRDIAAANEARPFDGKLILQADEEFDYSVVKQIMYTATIAGYSNIQLAAVILE